MLIQKFIEEISKSIIIDKCDITLFIGTGFSMWRGYPSCKQLLYDYCKEINEDEDYIEQIKNKIENEYYNIPKAFSDIINKYGKTSSDLKKYVKNNFEEITNKNKRRTYLNNIDTAKYSEIQKLNSYYNIITTNYDTLIEDELKNISGNNINIFYPTDGKINTKFFNSRGNNLLKLHGDNADNMIITS